MMRNSILHSINIPIVCYSSVLLLALHVLEENNNKNKNSDDRNDGNGGGLPELFFRRMPPSFLRFCCWVPIAAALAVLLEDAVRAVVDAVAAVTTRGGGFRDRTGAVVGTGKAAATTTTTAATATARADPGASWALVTGASKGIGRAIAAALAERGIPLVVVARDLGRLEALAGDLTARHGVPVLPFRCDLGGDDGPGDLLRRLAAAAAPVFGGGEKKNDDHHHHRGESLLDRIDLAFHNAGVGDSRSFLGSGDDGDGDDGGDDAAAALRRTETILRLNVLGTTKLAQALGRNMVAVRNRSPEPPPGPRPGRIVVVSSLMGAVPGVPGSAVYAATKAYQRSLCASLGRELDDNHGCGCGYNGGGGGRVSVLCAMPGAVAGTGFQSGANMSDSLIFRVPGVTLTPETVAESIVAEALNGGSGSSGEMVIGWIYWVVAALAARILPDRWTARLSGLANIRVPPEHRLLGRHRQSLRRGFAAAAPAAGGEDHRPPPKHKDT